MQKQRVIFLVIGVMLALVAVIMVKVQLDQQRQMAFQVAEKKIETIQANQVSVLVAKKDIPRGSMINADNLEVKAIPGQFVQPQAVTSLDRINGMVTIAAISKDEQITLSKLAYPKQAGGLAEATPVGKRAVSIAADNIGSLFGMIKVGDYVDVIATIPVPVQAPDGKQAVQPAVIPLFQNVLVLAVGQDTGTAVSDKQDSRYKKEDTAGNASMITLALGPQEANILAFVQEQEQNRVRFTLRSPTDAKIEPIQPASWDTLFQYIMPKEASGTQAKTQEAPVMSKEAETSTDYVEIYRGLKKERVPLSK